MSFLDRYRLERVLSERGAVVTRLMSAPTGERVVVKTLSVRAARDVRLKWSAPTLAFAADYDALYETLRTDPRQQWLFGFGRRYSDGRGIVTNSEDADETWHGFGLAVDIVHARRYWLAPEEFWASLGSAARRHGLVWGGDWPSFPDRPHLQWGGRMRRSPSPRAARLRESGGLPAVWAEVGAL